MYVREANVEDVPAIMHLERESSSAAHWPKRLYESIFAGLERSPSFCRLAWVVEADEETAERPFGEAPGMLAFLVARRADTEWELENIVVAETARRQGIGKLLLVRLIAQASALRGSGIFLEVRESNRSARALYEKAGFKETDLRKGYYSDPREDAVVCRLALVGGF